MSIWVALWLILSLVSLGFLGWQLVIIFRQKNAWKGFSEKYSLRYQPNKLMEAPEMSGVIEGFGTNFFGSEHFPPDTRSSRKLTAVEFTLNSYPPEEFIIASGMMVAVARTFDIQNEYKPDHKNWDKSYIALADNRTVLQAYLSAERLDVITRLMKVENANIMLIHKKDTTLLRMDIADPLMSAEKLEKIRAMMTKTARIFELVEGESKRLKSIETSAAAKDISLEVDEDDFEKAGATLVLEDDEEHDAKPETDENGAAKIPAPLTGTEKKE